MSFLENLLEKGKHDIRVKGVSEEKNRMLEEAIYNYELVKWGKGVHNVEYADALLNRAEEILKNE